MVERGEIEIGKKEYACKKCKDTGIVKEADGSCHTCWDCMMKGKLDQHSKDIPDSKIRF